MSGSNNLDDQATFVVCGDEFEGSTLVVDVKDLGNLEIKRNGDGFSVDIFGKTKPVVNLLWAGMPEESRASYSHQMDEKCQQFLIDHAIKIASSHFMDFPDYEDGHIQDVATALTVIVQSSLDHMTEFNEAEMYDFFNRNFPE